MFLLNNVTAPVTGTSVRVNVVDRTFQAIATGAGAITASVNIEVSNDGINFLVLGTISLSGTNTATDGLASSAKWNYVRATLTAITGTSAQVSTIMGAQ